MGNSVFRTAFAYTCIAVLISILAQWGRMATGECIRENACSCRDQGSGKLVSLYSLANLQGRPGMQVENGSFVFEFNPCVDITSPVCQDVAFCKHYTNAPPGTFYNLGTQSSVQFSGSVAGGDLSMQLQGQTTESGRQTTRTTIISLICESTAVKPELNFMAEQGNTYLFNLTSRCVCPGVCKPQPEQCVVDEVNKCSCRLDPGGKLVNLRSLNRPDVPLEAVVNISTPTANITGKVFFNPCSGMSIGLKECIGSSVCLEVISKEGSTELAFGDPSSAKFSVDSEGNALVSYSHGSAQTEVKLVCDYTARNIPKLTASRPETLKLDLELRSVCSCPGACVSPPVSCTPVDDCSCKISEDGGMVSLHGLDNPLRPLMVHHSTSSGDGQTFVYNPCSNFSIAGKNANCVNVAGCEFDGYATPDYPDNVMGLQSTAQYSVTQEGVVTISYNQGQQGRQFSVLLLCNKTLPVPLLSWLSEGPSRNYHLQLESEYGCRVPS